MQKKESVFKAAIFTAVIICAIFSAVCFIKKDAEVSATESNRAATVYTADGDNSEALIHFYQEKVDKLNKQCNILLGISILLLIALIVDRVIQPGQDIYEAGKKGKKKKSAAKKQTAGKGTDEKTDRTDIFDDAVGSLHDEKLYTVKTEVTENTENN